MVGVIPAYWLVDAQAIWTLRHQTSPIKLGLKVNNLLHEGYYFRAVDYSFGRACRHPGEQSSRVWK
ncbi:hypothetical protein [Salinisphaera sp. PC39]|uniref:hypothetical protein n=1 Tax=Salinisphaera sp. PC39 TaxID=1304156 RepID=UPI00333E6630